MRASILLGLLVTGCAALYPEPEAPICRAPTGLESVSLTCDALTLHEQVAAPAFSALTTSPRGDVSGWRVVVRDDVQWSEKYQRPYFTDASAPGWLLWGMVDPDAGTIYLADDALWRAVLAHEECHVRYPPPYVHADWPALGCDRVERTVTEQLTQASGVYDGDTSHGVFDPDELGIVVSSTGQLITGATSNE
jgi:hypothetical protein